MILATLSPSPKPNPDFTAAHGEQKDDSAAPLWLAVVPSYATDDDDLLVATAHADGSVRLWDAQLQPAGALSSSSSSVRTALTRPTLE